MAFLISIHAPREGSDPGRFLHADLLHDFYPRSPRGERHVGRDLTPEEREISIHAPREGSDPGCSTP